MDVNIVQAAVGIIMVGLLTFYIRSSHAKDISQDKKIDELSKEINDLKVQFGKLEVSCGK